MSVRKRAWTTRGGAAKTAWVVDYVDQHGKRHIETFQRKKEADAREAKAKVDVGKGIHIAPSESITVAEAAANWLNRVKADGRERSTLRQYETHVHLHIAPRIGRIKLAKLTTAKIEEFRNSLLDQNEGLSRPLARKVLTSLKSLLRQAKYTHLAIEVSIGRSTRDRRLEPGRDFPDAGEVKRLIQTATEGKQRVLLLTAALTGLRASELRGLRWNDVDLKAGELHVRQRADQFNEIGPPKSRTGTRMIPLAPQLVQALKRWKLLCPNGDANLVFPTRKGTIEYHANMLRSLTPVMQAAGVVMADGEPKYGLHAFRHFFASWCINPKERGGRELPAKVVQHLLGHSSIVMTLDIYGHMFQEGGDRAELAEAARLLLA
jgi:integrase